MTKTITRDVKENIFEAAMSLFSQNEYKKVDMKMIAQKSGIAVGTLYNYYENKNELYIEILRRSLEQIFVKLGKIDEMHISSKEKLQKCIEQLYTDIEIAKGLGKKLVLANVNDLNEDERIIGFKKALVLNLEKHIGSIDKPEKYKCQSIERKVAEVLLLTIILLIDTYPQDRTENIEFLIDMLNSFTK
ncbi:MAG: TetR/AcrR family transcriptional regulator [Tepidanaerobacteraceae bacterium]|nr:TetR/AcrR family transcriptional regulator [Tepidanaerobacteraceae bacterium]